MVCGHCYCYCSWCCYCFIFNILSHFLFKINKSNKSNQIKEGLIGTTHSIPIFPAVYGGYYMATGTYFQSSDFTSFVVGDGGGDDGGCCGVE